MAIKIESGRVHIDPEDRELLQRQYDGMSPSKRKRIVKAGLAGLGIMDAIVWFMCKHKLGPQAATEMMIGELARGEIAMEGWRVDHFAYPTSFWRWLGEDRINAAYSRGFFLREEIAELWRHLGRDDAPPATLKFPDLEQAQPIRH